MSEKAWHEQDEFWETFGPFMFTEERWAATPGEVDAVESLLALQPGAAVLDIGCGPGRHSLELARRGYRVTGIDRTRKYLAEARQRARDEQLDVDLQLGDMRTLDMPGRFDTAINMFTTFGYFGDAEEDLRAARNIAASLRPGGVFLLDTHGKETLARVFQQRRWSPIPGGFFLQETTPTDNWSRAVNRWIIVRDGLVVEQVLDHRLFAGSELIAFLREAGFASVDIFGSLEGSPYDHTARRLVATARVSR